MNSNVVIQGYGLTETGVSGTICSFDDHGHHVGTPCSPCRYSVLTMSVLRAKTKHVTPYSIA